MNSLKTVENRELKNPLLKLILKSNHEWICICNHFDGKIMELNSPFEKGIGINKKDLSGKSIFELGLTINGKKLEDYLKSTDINRSAKKNCELGVSNKISRKGTLTISLMKEGQSAYFIFSFFDKTAEIREDGKLKNNGEGIKLLKQDSQNVHNSKSGNLTQTIANEEASNSKFVSLLNAILENSTDLTMIVDKSGRIIYTSPSIHSLLGYSDLKNIYTIIPEKEVEKVKAFLLEVSAHSKGSLEIHTQVKHSNGTYRTLSFIAKDHTSTIGIEGILINSQDITEILKAKEEFALALDKEKELNRQKTQFISTVSHDFRTPLTNISLNLQLLERQTNDYQNTNFAKNIERISNATKRLTALLNEVSLISREQCGKLNFNPENYSTNDLIDTIVEQVDYLFQHNVNPEIRKGKPIEVKADLTLLTHITDNLISNAIKFSPNKTPINFFLEIDNKGIFKLIVKDNGIGIPEDEIKFLFDPYFRASNVNNINGNGLGLSIVHRCIELHNGDIKIDSNLNKGTKVTVEIPLLK